MFTQGLSQEECYFLRIILIDFPLQVLILNNIEYFQYLSENYRRNSYILKITRERSTPNKFGVKYYHLFPGFAEDRILGYKFDRISPPTVSLSCLGISISKDLLIIRSDPIDLTHGPLDQLRQEDIEEFNNVGGLGIQLI